MLDCQTFIFAYPRFGAVLGVRSNVNQITDQQVVLRRGLVFLYSPAIRCANNHFVAKVKRELPVLYVAIMRWLICIRRIYILMKLRY
jgi:hypothetical protein